MSQVFTLQKAGIYAIPVMHYKMEFAAQVLLAYKAIKPDCIAVELPETMQLSFLHAASRLPDISVVITQDKKSEPLYYMSEPCDPAFEALRLALEDQIPAFCIDLDVDFYPDIREALPDPYAIRRIGLEKYYTIYKKTALRKNLPSQPIDKNRETFMAKKLKDLSLSYDRILFVSGMAHVENVLRQVDNDAFPELLPASRQHVQLVTLTENSCRDVMAEFGWISKAYEEFRQKYDERAATDPTTTPLPDRQKLIFTLYKLAAEKYKDTYGYPFPGYHFRNLMKFARNYSLIYRQLMPDLYQILSVARGCVDHNFAYETWEIATDYPFLRNIDNLPKLDLTPEQLWGNAKLLRFHLKQPRRKGFDFRHRRKDGTDFRFEPPGPFSICSYPKEDVAVEDFGQFLQKKGTAIFSEEGARTIPFSTSIEDGIDMRETLRHWAQKQLYVKVQGKPQGGVGSVVVIFDKNHSEGSAEEDFPWKTTWLGEHEQESDMAFYATPMGVDVVGPGISRCRYGGFMMSYPPRRMYDVWSDPDYLDLQSKAEVLLMAAIDYAVKPLVVYVAGEPPRSALKSFARRFGKKIIFLPIGGLSPITLNKIRTFHVLEGHNRRDIADEYIF